MKKGYRKVRRRARIFFEDAPRVIRSIAVMWSKPHPNAVYSNYGIWLWPQKGDVTFRFYLNASYGRFFSKLLHDQRAPFVFFDVGANQGLYAILASKNPQCAQVYAFEPVAQTADTLEQNLKLNACQNVSLLRKAISDKSGTTHMTYDPKHSGIASLRSDAADMASTLEIEVMNARDLDEVIPSEGPPIIMKVDVEGHEMTVLSEIMKSHFRDRIQKIFYECDEAWIDADALRKFLTENGFSSFQKVGDGTHYDVLAER